MCHLRSADLSNKWISKIGAEAIRLNPGLKCSEPPYEFCEYLDGEHKDSDVLIRHKGTYDAAGEAYAFIMQYGDTTSNRIGA